MKLEKLVLTNWLSHENAEIDLSRPLNLIFGRNASGKTAIADAIKWALCGRCRSTDRAGRGAQRLIRTGGQAATVMLRFTVDGSSYLLTRSQEGSTGSVLFNGPDEVLFSGRAAEARLEEVLGAPVDLVEALLDMPHFLTLPPARQSELLAGVTGLRLTVAEILEEARSSGLSKPAVESLATGLQTLAAGRETFGPEVLEAAYQRLYEKRKEAKKELAALQQRLPDPSVPAPSGGCVPTDGELLAAREKVSSLEDEAGKLREQIGLLRARLEERERTEREIGELKARLAKRKPQGDLPLGVPATEELEQQRKDLERTATGAAVTYDDAATAMEKAREECNELDKVISDIEHGETSCPSIYSPRSCPLSEAALGERRQELRGLKKELHTKKAAAVDLRKAAEAARKHLSSCKDELQEAAMKLRASREDEAKREGTEEASDERLGILEENLRNLGDPSGELSTVEGRLLQTNYQLLEAREKGEQLIKARHGAGEIERVEKDAGRCRARLEILEQLVRALSPKALPTRLIREPLDAFACGVNRRLDEITGAGAYRIAVRVDDGLCLDVFRATGIEEAAAKGGPYAGGALPIANLSESERLRIGIALAHALSSMTGLNLLVIDRADMLVGDAKRLLAGCLATMGMDSILVLASAEEPRMTSNGECGVWWVEEGAGVKEICGQGTAVA